MSVNYNLTLRTNRLQLVATAIDAGGGNGVLRLLDVANNVLSSLSLARPCGNAAVGVLTFNSLPLVDPAAAASGSATAARVDDSAGNSVITGLTVGSGIPASSGIDIYLSPSNVIAAGQTIAITAATITGN